MSSPTTRSLARRVGVLVVIGAVSFAMPACRSSSVGARCAGTDMAQDATFVLECKSGRWRRLISKADAATLIGKVLAQRQPAGPVGSKIAQLVVAPESSMAGYDRDAQFGVWADLDGNGCNTRADVLAAQSSVPVTRSAGGCTVVTGFWTSAWDGYSTPNASELHVDHVLAVGEMYRSGASGWTQEQRRAFYNDTSNLQAVTIAMNLSKSDKGPAEWQPPNRGSWCLYVRVWVSTKLAYHLTADPAEVRALTNMNVGCPAF